GISTQSRGRIRRFSQTHADRGKNVVSLPSARFYSSTRLGPLKATARPGKILTYASDWRWRCHPAKARRIREAGRRWRLLIDPRALRDQLRERGERDGLVRGVARGGVGWEGRQH